MPESNRTNSRALGQKACLRTREQSINYEFLLPLIGAGVAAAWTYGRCIPEAKTEKLTFVEDEVPLTGIKDDGIVMTQTGQVFKVVALSGQSVAGKRADDLEKAASARAMV